MIDRVDHIDIPNGSLFWCNSHERKATKICVRYDEHCNMIDATPCCDPKLFGIMLPCFVENLTGQVEIDE